MKTILFFFMIVILINISSCGKKSSLKEYPSNNRNHQTSN